MARGMSLHVGLNSVDPGHYGGWSGPLVACEADAHDMRSIAVSQGYKPTSLLTNQATRANVTAAIRAAAAALQPGDIFLFTYSGHGGQVPDLNGDEPDDMDETTCLYDGQLVDDALYTLMGGFKEGVRVFMLSDSCHSGSMNKVMQDRLLSARTRWIDAATGRLVGLRLRGMPLDVAQRTFLQNRSEYEPMLKALDPQAREKVVASVLLMSGCQDDQTSSDGMFNGLFTGKLKKVWKDGAFQGGYDSFHAAIRASMPVYQQSVLSVYGGDATAFRAGKPFSI